MSRFDTYFLMKEADVIEYVKAKYPDAQLVAGNVATAEASPSSLSRPACRFAFPQR